MLTFDDKRIGTISNYYGNLCVLEHDGKFYWMIENYDYEDGNLDYWDEIDKELYDALIAYENRRPK